MRFLIFLFLSYFLYSSECTKRDHLTKDQARTACITVVEKDTKGNPTKYGCTYDTSTPPFFSREVEPFTDRENGLNDGVCVNIPHGKNRYYNCK